MDIAKIVQSDVNKVFFLWQSNSKPRVELICDITNSTWADGSANKLLLNDNVCCCKEVSKINHAGSNVLISPNK